MAIFGSMIRATELEGLNRFAFEVGPIRPPSEAFSLLIRVTRNCPWNRCQFCHTYKGKRFEYRSVEEVKEDISRAKAIQEEIKLLAWRMGYGGRTKEVAGMLLQSPEASDAVRNVALWLYYESRTVFLQDANTLIMRTPELAEVIRFLKETFPEVERITSYARAKTAAKKSVEELRELRETGLSRLHIGLESGSRQVLEYMQKGVTPEEQILGGRKVKEAGISLCEYVMPGLGGKELWREHVVETARVLNEIDPDYIRLRSLHVVGDSPLYQKMMSGDFEPRSEDEVVEEIGQLLERLECHSFLKSDHILNLLPEVEGKLPEDKERMLGVIARYLSLPEEKRRNFVLGRRLGYYESLADLESPYKYERVEQLRRRIEAEYDGGVEKAVLALKESFV